MTDRWWLALEPICVWVERFELDKSQSCHKLRTPTDRVYTGSLLDCNAPDLRRTGVSTWRTSKNQQVALGASLVYNGLIYTVQIAAEVHNRLNRATNNQQLWSQHLPILTDWNLASLCVVSWPLLLSSAVDVRVGLFYFVKCCENWKVFLKWNKMEQKYKQYTSEIAQIVCKLVEVYVTRKTSR